MTTDEEALAAISVQQIGKPAAVGPQLRPPGPLQWQYDFQINFAGWNWYAPILVDDAIPPEKRDGEAKNQLKEIFVLIAKKVAEF